MWNTQRWMVLGDISKHSNNNKNVKLHVKTKTYEYHHQLYHELQQAQPGIFFSRLSHATKSNWSDSKNTSFFCNSLNTIFEELWSASHEAQVKKNLSTPSVSRESMPARHKSAVHIFGKKLFLRHRNNQRINHINISNNNNNNNNNSYKNSNHHSTAGKSHNTERATFMYSLRLTNGKKIAERLYNDVKKVITLQAHIQATTQ